LLRSVARLDATKTSLIKALSSNETATNWGVSTSSPEVVVYRRKILQALQQGDQVRTRNMDMGCGADSTESANILMTSPHTSDAALRLILALLIFHIFPSPRADP